MTDASPPHATGEHTRRVVALIAVATLLRMVVAAVLPLGVDESYEAVVSRSLSLSYFDHPPLVFWLTHAAAAVGGESPLALRWPFVLLFALTSWWLWHLTARLFGARAGVWAVLAAQLIPVFSLSSGGWVLPDGPLLCASTGAALALAQVLTVPAQADVAHDDASAWGQWLLVGVALGLAGLSKYHAVLLGAGMLAFIVSDAPSRRWLRRVPPYVAVLVAVLCVLPVFVWNAGHDWISFRFQGGRAAGPGNPVTATLQNVAGQAGYLLPWFWLPMVVLLLRGVRRGPVDRATWYCVCLGAPPVLVFTLASLGGRPGLPHWPAPGYFLLLPLLGAAIARWEQRAPRVARPRMALAAGVFTTLVALVVSHAATGWLAVVAPSLRRNDPAFELLEYRSLRDTLASTGVLRDGEVVVASDWIRAAKIGYALGPAHPVLVFNDDQRHFRFTTERDRVRGADGLLLTRVPRGVTTDSVRQLAQPFRRRADTMTFVRTVPVLRGADTALLLGVFRLSGLRGRWSDER